jgi:Domain of unknown function (DUF4389)
MAVDEGARRSRLGPIVLIVVGSIVGLVALGLIAAGVVVIWADHTQRDAAGYFTSDPHRFQADSYAITKEGVKLSGIPSGIDISDLARIRLRAVSEGRQPVFVGIGRERDVDAYLAAVAHARLRAFDVNPFVAEYEQIGGVRRPSPPTSRHFWVASAVGGRAGPATLIWPLHEGRWSVVLMNADGSPDVAADVDFGADIRHLGWLAAALLGVGALVLAVGVLMVVLGARALGAPRAPATPPALDGGIVAEPGVTYPAVLAARLDEPLSRWLWVVKWLLLVPHVIVLAFLWIAAIVLTLIAWIAILITGRYPRGIFEFNVGVFRWTWRVLYYGYQALATDRYPPFSLEREPDYPATLDVAYPERLSRGLTLVKWVLAIPQFLIAGIFVGGGAYWIQRANGWHFAPPWSGLIGLLTLFAGFAVLFTGGYPRGLYDFIMGLNRWVLRVAAYVALMTDEYPPFRLDGGANEPGKSTASRTS